MRAEAGGRQGSRVGGKLFLFFLTMILAGAVAVMAVTAGRGPDPDAIPTSPQVQDRLMSPFCPGLTVAECPSGQSAALRRRIDAMVASGRTNREIDAWAVANYGETVLGRPRGILAWLAPAAIVLGGLGLVLMRLQRQPRSSPAPAEPETPIPPEHRDRLLAELRSFARRSQG
jgi:cytochrome c-type biogenesis protein CcmH/NrfF